MKAITIVFLLWFVAGHLFAEAPPNVVLIYVDEVRLPDVDPDQHRLVPTPNLDKLFASGMRFSNGYTSFPWCSPSRAGLMTGRYPQRFGYEFNPNQPRSKPEWGLPLEETTIAEDFKQAGYSTAIFGKWHLGPAPELHPNRRGFDEFFGFINGAHNYLTSEDSQWGPYQHNGEAIEFEGYLTDVLANEVAKFIADRKAGPFFAYLPFNACHPPHEAPERCVNRVKNISELDQAQRDLAATIQGMDDAIGVIIAALEEHQLREKTWVIFTSDNGRPQALAMPWDQLRGGREQFWDGGWRMPFVWSWPGTIPANSTYPHLVSHLDIRATSQALIGVKADESRPLDGVDLLPYLLGKVDGKPHDTLFGRLSSTWAVRHHQWKLILPFGKTIPELYDIDADPNETNDVASAHPAVVRELQKKFELWNAQLAKPAWPDPPGALRGRFAG